MTEFRLRCEGITWSDLGDEIVVLDLRSSTYFSVRGTAAFLVKELMSGASCDALMDRLLAVYDTSVDRARNDVNNFVEQLINRDLVETLNAQ